jgi:hypothetical protein
MLLNPKEGSQIYKKIYKIFDTKRYIRPDLLQNFEILISNTSHEKILSLSCIMSKSY